LWQQFWSDKIWMELWPVYTNIIFFFLWTEVEDANKLHVKSQNYRMSALDKRLDRSEMKLLEVRMDSRLRLETMVLSGVGVIALLSFIMSLYSCARPDQRTRCDQRCPSKVSLAWLDSRVDFVMWRLLPLLNINLLIKLKNRNYIILCYLFQLLHIDHKFCLGLQQI
jgi:hypothetical protein